jgi:hypothetical protein
LRVLVGTCGFQRARGMHYSNLDVLEVQQTFYDPRDLSLFSKWRSEAPQRLGLRGPFQGIRVAMVVLGLQRRTYGLGRRLLKLWRS